MAQSHTRRALFCLLVGAMSLGGNCPEAAPQAPDPPGEHATPTAPDATLETAQRLFYNARYEAAAAESLVLRGAEPADLANDELRTSALLFQLKALLETPADKDAVKANALKSCTSCPALLVAFFEDICHGQNTARAVLRDHPGDEAALFYLGKLDLNYVWLQLGPLGRKTGWDEYWEARKSLDAVLKDHPKNVRAIVARAWIDYVVDTKMPWGTRWVLGGGSRKRALAAMRSATAIDSPFFIHVEAEFALWDILVRERDLPQATDVARRLARDFPDNHEVARFLDDRQARR